MVINGARAAEEGDVPPAEVIALLEQRQNARDSKDFKASDGLRDEISSLGWNVQDSKEGQKLVRKT
jgi:cysteinyl-tRNA synthetase